MLLIAIRRSSCLGFVNRKLGRDGEMCAGAWRRARRLRQRAIDALAPTAVRRAGRARSPAGRALGQKHLVDDMDDTVGRLDVSGGHLGLVEEDALLADLAQLRQREYLEAAAVC